MWPPAPPPKNQTDDLSAEQLRLLMTAQPCKGTLEDFFSPDLVKPPNPFVAVTLPEKQHAERTCVVHWLRARYLNKLLQTSQNISMSSYHTTVYNREQLLLSRKNITQSALVAEAISRAMVKGRYALADETCKVYDDLSTDLVNRLTRQVLSMEGKYNQYFLANPGKVVDTDSPILDLEPPLPPTVDPLAPVSLQWGSDVERYVLLPEGIHPQEVKILLKQNQRDEETQTTKEIMKLIPCKAPVGPIAKEIPQTWTKPGSIESGSRVAQGPNNTIKNIQQSNAVFPPPLVTQGHTPQVEWQWQNGHSDSNPGWFTTPQTSQPQPGANYNSWAPPGGYSGWAPHQSMMSQNDPNLNSTAPTPTNTAQLNHPPSHHPETYYSYTSQNSN